MEGSLQELLAALEKAAGGLALVSKKRMFGCDGLFANGNVFGLVWKEGRIGVRLPDEIAYAEAMKMAGASPWRAGTMTISHWVLVPEALHHDATRLAGWVRRAHALALSAEKRGGARAEARPAVKRAPALAAKTVASKRTAKTTKTTTKTTKTLKRSPKAPKRGTPGRQRSKNKK